MLGYMKVVCLILDRMLAFQPCSHAFLALTSLYTSSYILVKMFFIILVIIIIMYTVLALTCFFYIE